MIQIWIQRRKLTGIWYLAWPKEEKDPALSLKGILTRLRSLIWINNSIIVSNTF